MSKNRKRRKLVVIDALETPTLAQIQNGDFERDFVTHAETNTKVMAYRRRDSSILERWLTEANAGVLFPIQAQRFIADCIMLWAKVGSPSVTAQYGERIASGRFSDGIAQKDAIDQLHRFRSMLGPYQRHLWPVFENVVRHNEPAGVAGSAYANNPAQRIQSAKMITSQVATDLAGKLGY